MKKVAGYSRILGKRVKEQRLKNDLSQRELSERSSISIQTISTIENSKTYNLRKKSIEKLSYCLVVTEDYLKGLSDIPNQTAEGLIRGLWFSPDDSEDVKEKIINEIDSFEEGFILLAECSNKLNERDKERIIKILQAFVNE